MRRIATLLAVILCAFPAMASLLTVSITNSVTGLPDTNYVKVIPLNDNNPVLADGSIVTKGFAKREYPDTNGVLTIWRGTGFWAITNDSIALVYRFNDMSSNSTAYIQSGWNTYGPAVVNISTGGGGTTNVATTNSTDLVFFGNGSPTNPITASFSSTQSNLLANAVQAGSTNADLSITGNSATAASPQVGSLLATPIIPGNILIQNPNGSYTNFAPLVVSDAGFGTNLCNAFAYSATNPGCKLNIGYGNYLIHTTANILTNGNVYQFNGGSVYVDSSSSSPLGGNYNNWLFYSPQSFVTGWRFIGPIVLDGKGLTSKVGLTLQNGDDRRIQNVTFKNLQGSGVWFVGGGSATPDHYTLSILDNIFTNCYNAVWLGGEYATLQNLSISHCTNGVLIDQGNNKVVNSSLLNNVSGIVLTGAGGNPGHGIIANNMINHNSTNVWIADNLTQGMTFANNDIYSGAIHVGGQGAQFIGGNIGTGTFSEGVLTNITSFDSVIFQQGFDPSYTNGTTNVIFRWCRTLTNEIPNTAADGSFMTNLNGANISGQISQANLPSLMSINSVSNIHYVEYSATMQYTNTGYMLGTNNGQAVIWAVSTNIVSY